MTVRQDAKSDVKILAIETSSRWGSVAMGEGDLVREVVRLPEGNRHAAELMPAIQRLTEKLGWRAEEIGEVYLSLGPGSFTGLRIAIAIARAMHQAIGCKLLGVPTLDVIAENAPERFAYVVPILDAKRGQVFSARFRRESRGLVRILGPKLVDPGAFLRETVELAHGAPVAVLGEGVAYHQSALASVEVLDPTLWPPSAETVYRLGRKLAGEGKYADPKTLLPTYIRLPEAEEVWRKKHGLAV